MVTYIMREDFELLFKATDTRIEKSDFFWAPKFCGNELEITYQTDDPIEVDYRGSPCGKAIAVWQPGQLK